MKKFILGIIFALFATLCFANEITDCGYVKVDEVTVYDVGDNSIYENVDCTMVIEVVGSKATLYVKSELSKAIPANWSDIIYTDNGDFSKVL